MKGFPTTRHEMLRASYTQHPANPCKACGAPIEWWKTTNGKWLAFNPIASDSAPIVLHGTTCVNRPSSPFPPAAPKPAAPEPPSLGRQVTELRDRTHARLVVLVDGSGTYCSWANDIPAEDLRHDLISAANHIRSAIHKENYCDRS